ncbi:MAG TPA: AAA family ATPase [Allosphingosinicella sp.]|nr:AAA family ATPase [Allosphingosinicella sp.]
MTVSFKPAKRENVPLLIGLDGASGSGKTYTALELATGIAEEIGRVQGREGRIFGIDTERGRMLHYADFFKFMHGEIEPPFRPQAYLDALEACERAQADVVVVDSFSHEWEGEGGVREWADQLEAGGTRSPANWKEPKLAHKRLVNKMLAMRPHIIVCMRAEEKMRVENVPQLNADGTPKMWNNKPSMKMVITPAAELEVKDRWVPICEKRFPFEITTSLLLTPDQPGVPIPRKLQRQHMPFFPEGQRISREAGRQLAAWAMGGAASSLPTPGGTGDLTLAEAREDMIEAGSLAELEAVWKRRAMAPHREVLQPELERLKSQFAQATRQPDPHPQYQGTADGYDGV